MRGVRLMLRKRTAGSSKPLQRRETAIIRACDNEEEKGHALYGTLTCTDDVIVFCALCGYYASHQCIHLARRCQGPGALTKHRRRTINNSQKGSHPEPHKSSVKLVPIWRHPRTKVGPHGPPSTRLDGPRGEVCFAAGPEVQDGQQQHVQDLADEVRRLGQMDDAACEAAAAAAGPEHEEGEEIILGL